MSWEAKESTRVTADRRVELTENWLVRRLAVSSTDWLDGGLITDYHFSLLITIKICRAWHVAIGAMQRAKRRLATKLATVACQP